LRRCRSATCWAASAEGEEQPVGCAGLYPLEIRCAVQQNHLPFRRPLAISFLLAVGEFFPAAVDLARLGGRHERFNHTVEGQFNGLPLMTLLPDKASLSSVKQSSNRCRPAPRGY